MREFNLFLLIKLNDLPFVRDDTNSGMSYYREAQHCREVRGRTVMAVNKVQFNGVRNKYSPKTLLRDDVLYKVLHNCVQLL